MLVTRRRRIVEEEVIGVIKYNKTFTTWRDQREWSKYEQNRRDSFLSPWINHHELDEGLTQRLAKAGFYLTYGSGTRCFCCGVWRYAYFWKEGHDPETIHRPDCEFVEGQRDNVPVDSQQQNNREEPTQEEKQNSRKSLIITETKDKDVNDKFSNIDEFEKQHNNSVVPSGSQSTGFNTEKPTSNSGNAQELFTCENSVFSIKRQGRVLSYCHENGTKIRFQTTTQNVVDTPKHPEYQLESERLSTFRTWGVQSPEILCKAGFYYTGEKDVVRCFHCDGSLCNWEHAHDPLTEHALWYPDCSFIQNIKQEEGCESSGHGSQKVKHGHRFPASATVTPTVPAITGDILQTLIRDNQETERKVQATGRKLQALMETLNCEQLSSPHFVQPNRTMLRRGHVQWHNSSQDFSGSHLATVSRSDLKMCSEQMTMVPPAAETIQLANQTVLEHHKVLMKIASVITCSDELSMLGIWLGCDPYDVRRLKNKTFNLKDVAYEILSSFYDSVPKDRRWGILMEALRELKKNLTVKELMLEELHQEAQSSARDEFISDSCRQNEFDSIE